LKVIRYESRPIPKSTARMRRAAPLLLHALREIAGVKPIYLSKAIAEKAIAEAEGSIFIQKRTVVKGRTR